MAVFLYKDRLVSALKKVPNPFMLPIECLSVYAIELPHASRKIPIRGLYDEVIVIVHKTIGMAKPVVTLINLGEGIKEDIPISLAFKYGFLFVSSASDMVDCTRVFYA